MTVVTARVTGRRLRRLLHARTAPRSRRVVPFTSTSATRAAGIARPADRVRPAGRRPSAAARRARCRTARSHRPTSTGTPQICWPRGLPCDLFVRPIIEREGFMRSGGVVIGGATTRLVGYRYVAGTTTPRRRPRAARIRPRRRSASSGTRRCPARGSYPVRLVLDLETTYDDGTVRTSQVVGDGGGDRRLLRGQPVGRSHDARPSDRLHRHLPRREPGRRRRLLPRPAARRDRPGEGRHPGPHPDHRRHGRARPGEPARRAGRLGPLARRRRRPVCGAADPRRPGCRYAARSSDARGRRPSASARRWRPGQVAFALPVEAGQAVGGALSPGRGSTSIAVPNALKTFGNADLGAAPRRRCLARTSSSWPCAP